MNNTNNIKTIDITIIPGTTLMHKNTHVLEKIIYENFVHLANNRELSHTIDNIHKLFNSTSSFFLSASIDGALIGYILGEYINLRHMNNADGRTVCYISYIYVASNYRGKSIATNMMKILLSDESNDTINGWMLVFDTHKKHLAQFYSKFGFKPDILYKKYSQHEVHFKQKFV